jgi:hypothetical protein
MSRLSLQLPESLHRRLSAQARREGISLEQYLLYLLALRSAPAYSVVPIDAETVEAERARFAELLEELGPATHEEVRAALADRDPAEPEAGLTPELMDRLQRRIDAQWKGSGA